MVWTSKKTGEHHKNRVHGMSRTSFYNIWKKIHQRCNNKNCSDYKNYGDRGIAVCKKWDDFSNFYNDMYQTYKKGLTYNTKGG